jgi:transcription antitermination factor NusG
MPWAAAYCEPFRESLAETRLRALGFETFLPLRMVRLHRAGSPMVPRALFPNYVFVVGDASHWRTIRQAGGIVDLVRTGSEITTIPSEVITEIKARCDPNGVVPSRIIKAGEHHMVWNGNPLAGLVALVEQVRGSHCRAWVGSLGITKLPLSDLDPEPRG